MAHAPPPFHKSLPGALLSGELAEAIKDAIRPPVAYSQSARRTSLEKRNQYSTPPPGKDNLRSASDSRNKPKFIQRPKTVAIATLNRDGRGGNNQQQQQQQQQQQRTEEIPSSIAKEKIEIVSPQSNLLNDIGFDIQQVEEEPLNEADWAMLKSVNLQGGIRLNEKKWVKGVQRITSQDRLPQSFSRHRSWQRSGISSRQAAIIQAIAPVTTGSQSRSEKKSIYPGETLERKEVKEASKVEIEPIPESAVITSRPVNVKLTDGSEITLPSEAELLTIPLTSLFSNKEFATDGRSGLSDNVAAARLTRNGFNELAASKPTPLWKAFLQQFTNLLILLLIAAAAVSIGLTDYVEGVAIFIIVLINVCLAVTTERNANNALTELLAMSKPRATVIRDGQRLTVASRELVIGDIIHVESGDIIPADARLVESHSLKVNEMLITGESTDVGKKFNPTAAQTEKALVPPNLILSGTTVTTGHARAIVIATGPRSRIGQLAKMLEGEEEEEEEEEVGTKEAVPANTQQQLPANQVDTSSPNSGAVTPSTPAATPWKSKKGLRQAVFGTQPEETDMQKNLSRLGLLVSLWALVICILVFVIGIGRNQNDIEEINEPVWLSVLLISVSLAVSAIPEGLPLAVTVCLALGSQRLAASHALVRKLSAVESLGTVNVICTDKTGTLTAGKMTAVKIIIAFIEFSISGKGFNPVGTVSRGNTESLPLPSDPQHNNNDEKLAKSLAFLALLCSNARLVKDEAGEWIVQGSSTEGSLVVFAAKLGFTHQSTVLQLFPRVLEIPFSSESKMMITLHQFSQEKLTDSLVPFPPLLQPRDNMYLTCIKGAPNFLLPHCYSYINSEGKVTEWDDDKRAEMLKEVDRLASQALRVLAVAYSINSTNPVQSLRKSTASSTEEVATEEEEEEDTERRNALLSQSLTFVGLIGSQDPEREGIAEAIMEAKGAGIQTVMITGDYLETAKAIAMKIHLLSSSSSSSVQALDCTALRPNNEYLPPVEFDSLIRDVVVFARAQPRDKFYLMKSYQRQQFICSMTGDGSNDAPALKQADIGIAMGSGTAVAKASSELILLDDNFKTIIQSVAIGRTIYGNIQKFVLLLLGSCACQILIIFGAVLGGIPIPLQPLQILFINLATDGLTALALSANPGESDVMTHPPRPRQQRIIHGFLWYLVITHTIVLTCLLMGIYLISLYLFDGNFIVSEIYPTDIPDDQIRCSVYQNYNYFISESGSECAVEAVEKAGTVVFAALSLCENARAYTIRWYDHYFFYSLFSNKFLLATSSFSFTVLMLILFVPPIQSIFGVTLIPWYAWLLVLACLVITVVVDESVKKWLQNKRKKEREEEEKRKKELEEEEPGIIKKEAEEIAYETTIQIDDRNHAIQAVKEEEKNNSQQQV